MRRTCPWLLVLLSWIVPASVAAEMAAIRPEFQVSGNGPYYYGDYYPHNEGRRFVDITASADGTFVVVWDDPYTYTGVGDYAPGVFARRLDHLGRPPGPEFRVSSATSYAIGQGAVASDPTGKFVVVWDEYDAYYYKGILARRYNASGGALGMPFLVNAFTTDWPSAPRVAMDAGGNFTVVWADPFYNDYYGRIAGRRFDAAGVPLAGQFKVNSGIRCDKCAYKPFTEGYQDINIAASGAGHFMVVWREWEYQGSYGDVIGRVFDNTGTPTGPDFLVNTYTTHPQWGASVTADGSGGFVVVWAAVDDGYDNTIRGRRFDSAGSTIGGEFQVNTVPPAHYYSVEGPSVAADGAGNFVVIWDDQYYYSILGRAFDSSGAPVGADFRVDDNPEGYDEYTWWLDVAASAAGDFVVVWSEAGYYAYRVMGRLLGEAPVACTPAPKMGCKEQTVSKRGVFRFKKHDPARRNTLVWRWVRGQATDVEDLGDPYTTDSYALCVYDASANPQPLIDAAVPAGGACGKIPCWRELGGNRIDYFDRERFVGGMEVIRMKPGDTGRSRVLVRARKEDLALPDTPLTLPVTVQLQVANGECWTAEYSAFVTKNAAGVFTAKPGS